MRRWLRRWLRSEIPVPLEKRMAEIGGGWDGLELGKSYKAYVVAVPGEGEPTPEWRFWREYGVLPFMRPKPKRPICRIRDGEGNFKGRYIVTEVDEPVKLGQELVVFITAVGTRVVFATAET